MSRGLILVADDNTNNSFAARAALRHLGYGCDVVDNGEEAVRAASSRDYSLILMDCRMPLMDGYAATARIRLQERDSGRHVPIVAVTACALPGDRERCLDSGMDDYFTKPLSVDGLKEIVDRWMNRTRAEG